MYFIRKIIYLCIFWASLLNAQNIEFTASCDMTQVGVGETFTLEVKVSGDVSSPPAPVLPKMSDFDVISTGNMQSVSIINGKVSSSKSFSYTLLAKKIGKFTIGPCTMEYKGKTFETQPIEIEVVKSSSAPTRPQQQSYAMPGLSKKGISQKDLYATLSVSKNKAYVNEQIILTIKLYQGIEPVSVSSYIPPSFAGFWQEELGQSRNSEMVNGRRYIVHEIKYAIFPTKSGTYKIEPASLRCEVEDFFSFPFGGDVKGIKTNSAEITVSDLPSKGKPEDFSGAVGKFNISSKLDNQEIKQWEPATLSVTISGEGNIKAVEVPKLPELPDFKIYSSGSETKLASSKNKIAGQRIFKVILVPQREGRFDFPALKFSYFDPSSGTYKTLATASQSLTVLAGSRQANYMTVPGKEDVEVVGEDIRYIKTVSSLDNEGNYIYRNKIFLLIQFLPLLVLIFSFVYARQKDRLLTDKAYARAVNADKTRKKGLIQCQKALNKKSPKEFYEEAYKILIGYISGKLNVPTPALTVNMAINGLREKGVNEEVLKKLNALFTSCDLAKFGLGDTGVNEMNCSYKELIEVMNELSRKI